MIRRWLPLILWMGLIYWLSDQTTPPPIGDWGTQLLPRKVGHVVIFSVLGVLWLRALTGDRRPAARRTLWWAAGLSLAYAITDEIHQAFVPGRGPHVFDIVLDQLSALAGILGQQWLWQHGDFLPRVDRWARMRSGSDPANPAKSRPEAGQDTPRRG